MNKILGIFWLMRSIIGVLIWYVVMVINIVDLELSIVCNFVCIVIV